MNFDFTLPYLGQFAEYVSYEKAILPHEYENLEKLWDENDPKQATLTDGDEKQNDSLRKSSVVFLDNNEENSWIYAKLQMYLQQCNANYYGFDLDGIDQEVQLTQYDEMDFFNWHMDFARGEASKRKLSVTIQLSEPDDYEGGDLEFMINDKTIIAPREKGSLIIFPSFVMHRVTPITKGVRKSIVAWASGRPFR